MLALSAGHMSAKHKVAVPSLTEKEVTIAIPNPTLAGVVDVVSLWSLVRAINALRGKNSPEEFERALTNTINLNGALARFIEDDGIE